MAEGTAPAVVASVMSVIGSAVVPFESPVIDILTIEPVSSFSISVSCAANHLIEILLEVAAVTVKYDVVVKFITPAVTGAAIESPSNQSSTNHDPLLFIWICAVMFWKGRGSSNSVGGYTWYWLT